MDAKEIKADKDYLIRLLRTEQFDCFIKVIESYHQAKSKEEAEERYDMATASLEDRASGLRLRTSHLMDQALKLAAFGKEE